MKKLVLTSLISILLVFTASCRGPEEITIERISERELQLRFENLNSVKMYSLNLNKEDIIIIDMQKEEGALNFTIYDQSENEIYRGNGIIIKKFTIGIKNDGKYRIEIDGKRAKGTLKILVA